MRNMTVRRGVVAGLGAVAGALAAAAFVSTAPIASADDGSDANSVDYAGLASPAATYPELTFTNEFTLYSGNSYTEYYTDYTGTGMPTTTTDTYTLSSGDTEYGSADTFGSDYYTTATTGDYYNSGYDLADFTGAGGTVSDYFEPFTSTFGTF
jgi:hypothetical protein